MMQRVVAIVSFLLLFGQLGQSKQEIENPRNQRTDKAPQKGISLLYSAKGIARAHLQEEQTRATRAKKKTERIDFALELLKKDIVVEANEKTSQSIWSKTDRLWGTRIYVNRPRWEKFSMLEQVSLIVDLSLKSYLEDISLEGMDDVSFKKGAIVLRNNPSSSKKSSAKVARPKSKGISQPKASSVTSGTLYCSYNQISHTLTKDSASEDKKSVVGSASVDFYNGRADMALKEALDKACTECNPSITRNAVARYVKSQICLFDKCEIRKKGVAQFFPASRNHAPSKCQNSKYFYKLNSLEQIRYDQVSKRQYASPSGSKSRSSTRRSTNSSSYPRRSRRVNDGWMAYSRRIDQYWAESERAWKAYDERYKREVQPILDRLNRR